MSFLNSTINSGLVKGFTLLETLASVTILSFIIIGPLAVITGSSAYARQTKDSIVATYLAEESIELLQNQYDSIYILCKKDPANVICSPVSADETSGQISWRIFKTRLTATGGQPSCFLKHADGTDDNPYGCSYDYLDMIGEIKNDPPVRHTALSTHCPYLVELVTTLPVAVRIDPVTGDPLPALPPEKRHTYVCKETAKTLTGAVSAVPKYFNRSLSVESLPTFEGSLPILSQYNDDIRITSLVKYKGVNGVSYPVKIVRFMHAQP